MFKNLFILFSIILFGLTGCSKSVEKTNAKVKLSLAKIINLGSGIGAGGAILFGKSSSGEQFGKILSGAEESMDLANGSWVFYAVMWDTDASLTKLKGKAYCAQSAQELKGTAVSISLSLTNANCANADFAGSDVNVSGGDYSFAKIWLEECDDLNLAGPITCLKDNQGSAASYRYVFRSYKKSAAGALSLSKEAFYSGCKSTISSGIFNSDVALNFPTSKSGMPFVISVEMFLGKSDCGASEPETKGVYTTTLTEGLSGVTSVNKIVKTEGNYCPSVFGSEAGCIDHFGYYSASGPTCVGVPEVIRYFNKNNCSGASLAVEKGIKQMVSIPKSFLCRFNDALNTGKDSFAGGTGSKYRPYKICNEWQINQIGEQQSSTSPTNSDHYKLMNNLDMNVVTQGVYPQPQCIGVNGVEQHMNLNPLDGFLCGSSSSTGYGGTFNGNGYTISNARITSELTEQLGFVRELQSTGVIKNLNFKNLSVRGREKVGGIVGALTDGRISNVKIFGGNIESDRSGVGGAVGYSCNYSTVNSKVSNVELRDLKVRGANDVGGFIGNNCGSIHQSMFSGIVLNDQSNPGNSYAGGFVAFNQGSITESFSEGYIGSQTNYIGGFAAANEGTMTSVYSTMAIASTQNSPGTIQIGGIAASNESTGIITDCLSDTRQKYHGGGTVSYSGTVLSGSGTTTKCYTDSTNSSSHSTVSYFNLRQIGWANGSFLTGVNGMVYGTKWKLPESNGGIPRLAWETRECLQAVNLLPVSDQAAAPYSRGTATNPILICTIDQLYNISLRSAAEHYRLADNINLSKWSDYAGGTDGVSILNGSFFGDNKALYGMSMNIDSVSAGENIGIFKYISSSAKVSFLNLFVNELYTASGSVNFAGLLSSVNHGEISDLKSYSSYLVADSQIGTLVSTNEGTIKNVIIRDAKVIGTNNLGGVVGANNGSLHHVSASVNISSKPLIAYQSFGGVVGYNQGTLDQAVVRGEINLQDISAYTQHQVGGLVGFNSGTISNTLVDEHFRMNFAGRDGIGGLVGVMSGASASLVNSFSLGKMIFTQSEGDLLSALDSNSGAPAKKIGPLVGKHLSGASTYYGYFLPYSLLIQNGNNQILNCNSGNINLDIADRSAGGVFYDRNYIGAIPYTFVSANVITPDSSYDVCSSSGSIEFFKAYGNETENGFPKTIAQFKLASTFNAYNIAIGDTPAVLNYHFAKMNGLPIPAGTPIWNLESGDDYPRLLQIDD